MSSDHVNGRFLARPQGQHSPTTRLYLGAPRVAYYVRQYSMVSSCSAQRYQLVFSLCLYHYLETGAELWSLIVLLYLYFSILILPQIATI